MEPVRIGSRLVGPGQPTFITAEIGINHNGELGLAKALIDAAIVAGCDAVKFQKRTVDVVYSREELARPRESPYGETNGDLKRGLEFDEAEYEELASFCDELGMTARGFTTRFRDAIGLAPKAFSRVRRIQHVVDELNADNKTSWAEAAVRHGFYDQSHLINDFHQTTGMTPTTYAAQPRFANHVALPDG